MSGKRWLAIIVFAGGLISCTNNTPVSVNEEVKPPVDTVSPVEETLIPDTVKHPDVKLSSDLAYFQNVEQVDFCVPIPFKEYALDQSVQRERGDFLFINNADSSLTMQLTGMFRADPSVSIETYFKNSYAPEETEEQGKIVTEKKITGTNNCFYAKGYYNNLINKERFIEIFWLRKDDVVRYTVNYSIKDTALWNTRLTTILETDSYCY